MNRLAIFGWVLVATIAILLVLGAASSIPPFPFQNTQQLGPGIPGLAPYETPLVATCEDGRPLVVFSFGSYSKTEGAHGWQVYVEIEGNHLTGAYFDGGIMPKAIYFGTAHPANGHITITRAEPFDPTKHHGPCEEWK